MAVLSAREKMNKIQSFRRDGDTRTVANKTGYSISHVSNVAAGRRKNGTIINSLYELVKSRRK